MVQNSMDLFSLHCCPAVALPSPCRHLTLPWTVTAITISISVVVIVIPVYIAATTNPFFPPPTPPPLSGRTAIAALFGGLSAA